MTKSICAVICLITCTASSVRAEERDLAASANAHLENGIALYRRGALDEAIVELNAAYAISPTPTLLFDLAQAYRKKGELALALDAYRGYLAARPEAPDAPTVRAHIATLEGQLLRGQPSPAPRPIPPSSEGSVDRDRPHRRRVIAAVATSGALGVTMLAVAGALLARSAADATTLAGAPPGSAFDDHQRAVYAEGRATNSAAIGLFVVGGATLAGALTALIVERKSLRAHPRVAFREGRWVF
jgi:tetratricopeptide (TPR) repeat protein